MLDMGVEVLPVIPPPPPGSPLRPVIPGIGDGVEEGLVCAKYEGLSLWRLIIEGAAKLGGGNWLLLLALVLVELVLLALVLFLLLLLLLPVFEVERPDGELDAPTAGVLFADSDT